MAKRGEFPVEHCQHPWFILREDHVVQAEVAVDDRGFVTRRNMRWQPLDQRLHGLDLFSLASPILFGPARDLAFKIIARAAKITQSDGVVIHGVERRDDPVHVVEDRCSFGR